MTYSTDGVSYGSTAPQYKDATVAGGVLVYVRVQIAGAADYVGTARVEITKVPLTVKAVDKTTTYGQDAPAFSVKYSGFVLGEDEVSVGGPPTYTCDYSAGDDVGEYTITPAGLCSGNYDIKVESGKLTVGKAALTVKAEDKTTTYGQDAPAFSVGYSGFVLSDNEATVGGPPTYACAYAAGSDVGEYAITPVGLSSGNYDITVESGKLTVDKAALTVTADDKAVTYLDAPPAYTATYSGFVAGDESDDLDGSLTFSCAYTAGSAVGNYVITPGGVTSVNYDITFDDGTLSVAQLILTVRFEDYNGALISTDRVVYGRAANAPEDPEREGYNFAGWDRSFDNVTASMTVTATYTIQRFTVTFEDFDGTVLGTDTVDWNTAATAPADPERDGYTFTGWDTDFSAVTANITVTAQYSQNAVIEDEPVPQTGGDGDDKTAALADEDVPLGGPAAFPWWWILVGVGAAAALFLLIFFFAKKRKKQEA